MKKLLSALVLISCFGIVQAQNRESIKLESFDRISFGVGGKLYLRQGAPQKVEVQGDKEDLKDVIIRVEGDRLVIKRENWKGWTWNSDEGDLVFYVTVPDIEAVSVGGSGDLIAETKVTSRNLDLSVSGSGSMDIEAYVSGDLEANVSGSGMINFKGKCTSFDSHVSGSGKLKLDIAVADNAAFGISGSGKILASGSATDVRATISGSGEVLAANLVTEKCDVRISGSGDVEINVSKELDANISGSGNVAYRGNPAHVNSHASGSGGVRKL